jgi:hypothetical protein
MKLSGERKLIIFFLSDILPQEYVRTWAI